MPPPAIDPEVAAAASRYNKLTFTDKTGLEEWFDIFAQQHDLQSVLTYSPSRCGLIPSLTHFKDRMHAAKEQSQRDAVYSEAVIEICKLVAPVKEFAWASCVGTFVRGMDWMKANASSLAFHKEYDVSTTRSTT